MIVASSATSTSAKENKWASARGICLRRSRSTSCITAERQAMHRRGKACTPGGRLPPAHTIPWSPH
eukprot:15434071-Alexandrium_andersonii.AAC.1